MKMNVFQFGRRTGFLAGALAGLLVLGMACSGGAPETVSQAPAQPAAAAQPQPAAPAQDPMAPTAAQSGSESMAAAQPAQPPAAMMGEPKYGGILRVGHRGDPPQAWDAMRGTSYDLTSLAPTIYGDRNMVKPCREDDSDVCPAKAVSWESNADFTVWTFTIRDGIKWHDGVPFTAEDTAYWLNLGFYGAKVGDQERLPATSKASLGDIKNIEVVDGNKVRVTLGRPTAIYPTILANHYGLIIQHPKHLMEPRIQAGEVNVTPQDIGFIGTGPFKMEKYEKNVIVQVRRSDLYWEKNAQGGPLPYLDGLDFFIVRDPQAFHAAFRGNRLDAGARGGGFYVEKELLPAYERSLGDKVWFGEILGGRAPQIAFNVLQPPFNDVRVRRAVHLWANRQSAIDAMGGGDGQPRGLLANAAWSNKDLASWPGYNQATKEQDRAEAKRLLAEAGYPDGLEVEMLARRPLAEQNEWWQGELAPLGIQLKLNLNDYQTYDSLKLKTDWKVIDSSISAPFPERLEERIATKTISPRSNIIHEDQKITEFFERLNGSPELETRRAIFQEMERYMLVEQVYTVQTFVGFNRLPIRSHVKGIFIPTETPPTHVDYATVWLDK